MQLTPQQLSSQRALVAASLLLAPTRPTADKPTLLKVAS
jgi:hypothetical protein